MHMSSNLDPDRLSDLARDPNSHAGSDMAAAAYAVLQSALAAHPDRIAQAAQRAVLNTAGQAIDAALRPCFDPDYVAEMWDQLDCAEHALHQARAALDGHPSNATAAMALMSEARGYLTGEAADPELLASMKQLTNEVWPYLTAAQRESATAAIAAATGEAL